MDIAAGALFANLSGTVSGAGVWVGADDIVHATAVRRDRYDNGFAERAQHSARIASSGDLTLDAARLQNEGETSLEAAQGQVAPLSVLAAQCQVRLRARRRTGGRRHCRRTNSLTGRMQKWQCLVRVGLGDIDGLASRIATR